MAEEKILSIKLLGDAKSRKAIEDLQISVDKLRRQRTLLNKQEKQGLITSREASKRRALLNAQLKATTTNLNALTRQQLLASKAIKQGTGLTTSITKGFANFALQMGAATLAITVITSAIKGAINIVKDFQQANADLAAVLGKTRGEIKELTKDAKRLGSTTAFTATEVSKLQKVFAKLGFSTQEILNATEATLDLAAATGTDLARAAEVAGGTIRGFQLDASETTDVVDIMTKAFSKSGLDTEKFAEAIKLVAPTAVATKRNLTTVTSQLGTLADNMISGSIAGTQLNRVFIELNKKGITLEEAISKVKDSSNGLATATDLVKDRGAKALLILAKNTEQTAKLKEALDDAGGTARIMAETQLDTLTGSTIKLSSAWEGFILSLEDGEGAIAGAARSIIEDLTAGIAQMSGEVEEGNEKFSVFGTIFEALRINFKVMKAIILTTFIIPVREGIAAITALGNILGTVFRPQIEAVTSFFNDTVLPAFRGFRDLISDTAKTVLAFGSSVLNKLGFDIDLSGKAVSLFNEIIGQTAEEVEKSETAIKAESDALGENSDAVATNTELTEKQIAAKQKLADELLRTQEALVKQLDQLEVEATEDDQEREEARALFAFEQKLLRIETEGEIENEVQTALKNKLETDLQAIDDKFTKIASDKKKKDDADKLKKDQELSDAKFDLAQGGLNAIRTIAGEESKIGRVAAIASRGVAVAEATIALAKGLAKTASVGFPQNIPLILGFIAQTAGLVSSIKSVKLHHGAVLEGASHANGGIKFTVGGRPGFEAEGGEAIINKRSTRKHRKLLSAINVDGGGRRFEGGDLTPIHKFQGGDVTPSPVFSGTTSTQAQQAANLESLAERIGEEISDKLNDQRVINNVVETTEQQRSVENTEAEASL